MNPYFNDLFKWFIRTLATFVIGLPIGAIAGLIASLFVADSTPYIMFIFAICTSCISTSISLCITLWFLLLYMIRDISKAIKGE